MVSERMQRRIDALLDEADEAITQQDWSRVAGAARAVLAIEESNADALGFLKMAEANGASGADSAPVTPTGVPAEPSLTASTQPDSFAGGRYRVQRALGEGAKKRVYLAHDELLDRDVALALIKTEGLDDVGRERVVREAQAMGRLGTHPHLVAVLDFGQHEGSPFIVTEYLAGGSVADLVNRGTVATEQALEIASGVARGLAFAHEQNVIHRDLKPGNVWLASDGVAKIGDFGLAVSLDESRLTQHGMMIGTVAYMPPEQALAGEVTPRSDLYALGAMLYELLTGAPPFVGEDATAVISQHVNTAPVRPSLRSEHCPPDLEGLILRLLAKAPDDRPASATEVLAALQAIDPIAVSASDSHVNPLDRLARGVFVGREGELERLRNAADEAFAGRGSVVMLVGEPGIGKTRTAQELETYARMRGAQVLWGRAHEASGAPAYWPWVQIGRSWGRANDVRALAEVLQGAGGELVRLFPELPGILGQEQQELPAVADESAQFRLFDAYTNFLRAAADDSPLMIVLDDIHWADKPTLLLLQHLAREVHNVRILLVGTYRDTELARTHPLSEALAELNREGGFQRVVLRGLDEPEVRAYLAATTGREPARELVTSVYEETEGNPFFLSEVVNLLAEEGTLDRSVSDIALPDGVREALGRRLDRLSEGANELLRTASVVGRDFEYETLKLLTKHNDDAMLALIEEGLAARVIEELGQPGRYQFRHALMQETLLDELSTTRRVRMHGEVGHVLEARLSEHAEEEAARLARHFMEAATLNAELASKAFRYSTIAGERAERSVAWGDAIRHYRNSLELLRESRLEGDEAGLLVKLTRCLTAAIEHEDAWEASKQAQAIYAEKGDPVGAAEALIAAGSATYVLLEPDEMRLHRQSALAGLGDADPHLRARLLTGWLFAAIGDEDIEEAEALASAHGGYPDVMGNVHTRRAFKAYENLRLGDAREQFALAYRAFDEAGEYIEAAQYLRFIGFSLLHEGRLDESVAANEEALAYARKVGARLTEHIATVYLADVALLRADFARIDELAMQCSVDWYWMQLLQAARLEQVGEMDQALDLVPAPDTAGTYSPSHVHGARARLLWNSGQRDAAREELDRWANSLAERGDWRVNPLTLEIALAEVDECLPAVGARELIARTYETLAPWVTMRVSRTSARGFDRIRGNLALELDRIDEAEQHFQTGLEWCERERCPVEAGRNLQGLAEIARRRGERGPAFEYLEGAGVLFSRHGTKLYLDQVLAKKAELRA